MARHRAEVLTQLRVRELPRGHTGQLLREQEVEEAPGRQRASHTGLEAEVEEWKEVKPERQPENRQ